MVDNGSNDGTVDVLRHDFPSVVIEHNAEPLSFARAVNRGLHRARYSHVCVLNNDMLVEPGFLTELRRSFDRVPDLFSSTAQIFFPAGQRREETGKTVIPAARSLTDFPVRCDEPLEGEDQSYVLYGSGGCTLYDAAKLASLGGFDEIYDPAYVEDLDMGVRAWERGWPSVYCAAAQVLHLHRATTSRYFTEAQLDQVLERNFIRFLADRIVDRATFQRMWRENVVRLNLSKKVDALAFASRQQISGTRAVAREFSRSDQWRRLRFSRSRAARQTGDPGRQPVSPVSLSHGAAVRIYNLMRRAAADFDQVLVAFVEDPRAIPEELRDLCVEVVTVRRAGTHALPSTPRPDTVEEFDSAAFHAVLKQTVRKWRPKIVQLEFTQMAQYAIDCAPPDTLFVEHDVTYDLYAQMLAQAEDWEVRRQYERWLTFEQSAWKRVDRVVVMSEKIGRRFPVPSRSPTAWISTVSGPVRSPEPRRLLFIGSFAHRPNVLAMEFFLREVFPRLSNVTLHVIAGMRHERFWNLHHDNVEVESFVSDVRPAYRKATLVIAPLIASAGTNIKIMEAMAMGKAIVSTPAGIHGLDLKRDRDVVVTGSAEVMAAAIAHLLDHPEDRVALERNARATAERLYDWDAIAVHQRDLYASLIVEP